VRGVKEEKEYMHPRPAKRLHGRSKHQREVAEVPITRDAGCRDAYP